MVREVTGAPATFTLTTAGTSGSHPSHRPSVARTAAWVTVDRVGKLLWLWAYAGSDTGDADARDVAEQINALLLRQVSSYRSRRP